MLRLIRFIFLLISAFGYAQVKPTDTAQYYLKAIKTHYKNGEYTLHKAYSDSLYNYAQKRGLLEMQIKAMVNQGVGLNMQGDYQNALAIYNKALTLSKTKPKDTHTQVLVMVNLANTYSNIGLYNESVLLMKEVLQKAQLTQQPDLMRMAALSGLSKNFSALGNEKEALEYAKQVRALAQKLGNRSAELTAINHISNSYYKLGHYDKAIAIAEEALAYKEMELPTKAKAWVLLSLGEAHLALKHYNQAKLYLSETLQIAKSHNILETQMLCYEKLAEIYKAQGNNAAFVEAERKYADVKIKVLSSQKEGASSVLKAEIVTKEHEQIKYKKSIAALTKKNRALIALVVFGVLALLFLIVYRQKRLIKKGRKTSPEFINSTPRNTLKAESYKNSALSATDRVLYKQRLEDIMVQEKPYLKDTFSQTDLAKILHISTHHLSEVLHYEFKQNFYALVNQYRVDYSKKLLEDVAHKDTKMLAIAYESGFKSKTTFYRVFKKLVGKTPLEYKTNIRV